MPETPDTYVRQETSGARPTRRQIAIHGAKALIALGLLGVCFSLIDTRGAINQIASMDAGVFVAALACALLGTIIFPALIVRRALAINKLKISLPSLIAINLAVRFYVIALPRIVATAIRWSRYGGGRFSADAFALMAYERVVQFAVLFLLSFLALLMDAPLNADWRGPLLALLAAGSAMSLLMLAAFHMQSARTLLARLNQGLERLLPAFVSKKIARLVDAVAAFRGLTLNDIAIIAVNSAAAFIFFVLSAFLIAHAIGVEIGLLPLVWIRSAVFVITLLPVSIAGIGLREVSFIGFLSLYGISEVDALAFSLANFSVQLTIAAMGLVIEAARFANGRFFPAQNTEGKAGS